jgi:hypothetical protein
MADPVSRLNAALEGRYPIERDLGEGVITMGVGVSLCGWLDEADQRCGRPREGIGSTILPLKLRGSR